MKLLVMLSIATVQYIVAICSVQPQISSEQQLVGAPAGTQVQLTCLSEVSAHS
jgi:hypothetical protein